MRHSWLWWLVVGCIVIYVISNPAQAASQVRGIFESGATFIQGLASAG